MFDTPFDSKKHKQKPLRLQTEGVLYGMEECIKRLCELWW
jgi:hypothetical protein